MKLLKAYIYFLAAANAAIVATNFTLMLETGKPVHLIIMLFNGVCSVAAFYCVVED